MSQPWRVADYVDRLPEVKPQAVAQTDPDDPGRIEIVPLRDEGEIPVALPVWAERAIIAALVVIALTIVLLSFRSAG